LANSLVIAASPPHDVPIATTEYLDIYFTFLKIFSGAAICW
jgi:hypothetical protein